MMKSKAEFGSDTTAQGGHAVVKRSNNEFYAKATPKQRKIIDAVQTELDLINQGHVNQYFLERIGFYAEMDLDGVLEAIKNMKSGEFRLFGKGHYLVKTCTGEIQELQAYTRRLETVVARGEAEKHLMGQLETAGGSLDIAVKELESADEQVLKQAYKLKEYRERSFWAQIKAAFQGLRSK